MNNKYTLTEEGHLFRLTAKRDIHVEKLGITVMAGTRGGLVTSESTLSADGDCWVFDGAVVAVSLITGDAVVLPATTVIRGRLGGSTVVEGYSTIVDCNIWNSWVGPGCCLTRANLRGREVPAHSIRV